MQKMKQCDGIAIGYGCYGLNCAPLYAGVLTPSTSECEEIEVVKLK